MCEDGAVGESNPEVTISTGTIEDREETRFQVDLAVTVNSESNFYAGFASNISAGGIFVATHIVHPVGTKFNLSIHLDEAGIVRGVGEVRWLRAQDETAGLPAGLGIRFTEVEGDGAERIEAFLDKRGPMKVGPSKVPPDE